nr:ribonuclease H-like domain-containing protein [Tanacetum cinerariifolium]
MSVHNFEHYSPINPDHDDDVHDHDPVTRISKLDISDLLHLHHNDTTALIVVSIKLKGIENYQVWSCAMLLALEGKNKIDFIDGSCKRSNTYEVLGFKKHNQLLKLIQFLMGLDDSYMQIRSSILSREVLPDVRSAYATISSEESHRVAVGSIAGHPNGTEAYISKIRNLRLFNGLTQYNVMVIPKYYVTLISVHKLVKENRVIVAFDENRCYFLNQDLNLKNVIGIGKQCEGLYYYNDKDPVLNVLKDSLNIDKKDNTDSKVEKNDSKNVFQDVNHINYFDIEYPEIYNDDERVANDMNKDKSDSSSPSVSGSNINTADFPVDSGNDDDSSENLVATKNKKVATLEENVFLRVTWIKIQAHLEMFKIEPKTYSEASKYSHWTGVMNQEIDVLLRNGTWEFAELPEGRKAIRSKWIYKIKFRSSGVFFALLVYVDDIIITGNSIYEIEKFKFYLTSKFMIKDLEKLKYFLGIKVIDTDKCICLNQRKYVLDLLSEYGMLACKPAKTPLMSKLIISNEASENDPLLENVTDYQRLMGKLIYLTNTRPDISYDVHCLSQFMHSPLSFHLKIAFKIFRYLKSCSGLGIHIARTSGMFLNAYSDVDLAKCIVTRKSVTGYCVFFNNSLVSWKSKKQNTLSLQLKQSIKL